MWTRGREEIVQVHTYLQWKYALFLEEIRFSLQHVTFWEVIIQLHLLTGMGLTQEGLTRKSRKFGEKILYYRLKKTTE